MGNRLSRIVTRTGDDGTTALGDGTRVSKSSERVEALGSVDELNSLIGLLISTLVMPSALAGAPAGPDAAPAAAAPDGNSHQAWLLEVQHDLFDLGAELSVPGLLRLDEGRILALEEHIGMLNAALPPLKEFVLPGGTTSAALCHLARTVCRRAERRAWALVPAHAINTVSLRYLNRLSDALFVLARTLARAGGGKEILWRSLRVRS